MGEGDDDGGAAYRLLAEELPDPDGPRVEFDGKLGTGNPVPALAEEAGVGSRVELRRLVERKPGEGSGVDFGEKGLLSETRALGLRIGLAGGRHDTRRLLRPRKGGGEYDGGFLRRHPGAQGRRLGPAGRVEGEVETALHDPPGIPLALAMADEEKADGLYEAAEEIRTGEAGLCFDVGCGHCPMLHQKMERKQRGDFLWAAFPIAASLRRGYFKTVRATTILALAALPFLLSSCYVTSEGLHYLGLLSKGRPVAEVIADPSTSAATKTLLRNAEAIQAFGVSVLGEKPTRNYRKIVEIQGDTLVHVVQACASLSFDRWLWSYPFVGKLPYRGYFELKDAEKEAALLRAKGLDVIVRDADAFSTLGWLSDPLWSFMANYGEADIADLILHESMHATAFRTGGGGRGGAGSDDWNEGIATFVGRQGSILWLESRYGKDSKEVADALAARKDAETFASFLRETAKELEAVYSSPAGDDEKRKEKAAIIAARAKLYEADYSSLFVTDRYKGAAMDRINNAWLDLYRLYEGEPALYRDWYEKVDKGDLRAFVADMKELAKGKTAPLVAMRQRLDSLR